MNKFMPALAGRWNDIDDADAVDPGFNGVYGVVEVAPEPSSLALASLAGLGILRRGKTSSRPERVRIMKTIAA